MTADRNDLLQRIESFEIDGPDQPALPFAARLAREQGWSRPFAERVITEYKRYVFLCMTSETPVCPSEEVDAAWHLHLTYTRSYWKRFCGEVLGRQLHHEPTKGGPAEAAKHFAMYDRTFALYREVFGAAPPADVWPPRGERFGAGLRHRVVNTARNWVIPKRPVKRVLTATAAFLALATMAPGCAGGTLNPFNLVGTQFLYFLIPVLIAAVCLGRVIRSVMRTPGSEPGDEDQTVRWDDAAYLAGGYPRLTTAAIARLVEAKAAVLADDAKELRPVFGAGTDDFGLVEMAVYRQLPFANTAAALKPVQEAVEAVYATRVTRLEQDGFALPKDRQVVVGVAALVPLALVIVCLGLPRLMLGWNAGKPIGYLGTTLLVGGFIGLVAVLAGAFRRTRRGDAVVAGLQARHGPLATGSAGNLGLAVALYGTAALAGTEIAYLQAWYPRQTTGDGGCGSGCGTGGGGGGCGGGGGGCGGCG